VGLGIGDLLCCGCGWRVEWREARGLLVAEATSPSYWGNRGGGIGVYALTDLDCASAHRSGSARFGESATNLGKFGENGVRLFCQRLECLGVSN
jgi:hypothetical protein